MINCPKCASEKLVQTPALGNIPLDVCPGCSGIWFNSGELEALMRKYNAGADFALIEPKPVSLECPSCHNKMSRGGLLNPLLKVDKCEACGGLWLDSNELALVNKLLGIAAGPAGVAVERQAGHVDAPAPRRMGVWAIMGGVAMLLGISGLSYELYQYLTPVEAVEGGFSPLLTGGCVILCIGGVFGLRSGK